MKNSTLRWFIFLGMLTIMSSVGIQLHLLRMAFSEGQKKFSQTVHIALLEAMEKMYGQKSPNLSETGPVKKISNDYYIVDVNDHIHADVLEFYLKSEFTSHGIDADFEYGIYDCETDQMVYGNYIQLSGNSKDIEKQTFLPKYPELVYYFGIRFPSQANYVIGTLKIWIILASVSLIILLFFVYAIFIVLRQKRLSELQRDFVNNMTHEFKTPLTANKIALDFIRQSEAIREDERLSKYCEMISSQTEHLNQQIERILQISFSEKRTFALHKEVIELIPLVEKVAGSFLHVKRKFVFNFDPDSIFIFADQVHLTNALYSLLDNAIKYSADDSGIELSVSSKESMASIVIRDEGLGMERNQQKKIFNKFHRVPTGNIHNVKGFGLGLFYVRRVVERHGWRIKVHSKPGEGSEFIIKIAMHKK